MKNQPLANQSCLQMRKVMIDRVDMHSFCISMRLSTKRFLCHFGNGISIYSVLSAVIRSKPIGKVLCTLARIAGDAASCDIFTCDYRSVINNVFPTWLEFPSLLELPKSNTAVNTFSVTVYYLILQRFGDVPVIHF
jgi:hypothetical protein